MLQLSEKYNVNIIAYDYYGFGLNQFGNTKNIKPNENNTYKIIDTVYKYLTENLNI